MIFTLTYAYSPFLTAVPATLGSNRALKTLPFMNLKYAQIPATMIARACTVDCTFLITSVIGDSGFGTCELLDLAATLAALAPGSGIALTGGGVFAICWARGGEVSANAGLRETVQISSKENKNVTSRTLSGKAEECVAFVTLADFPLWAAGGKYSPLSAFRARKLTYYVTSGRHVNHWRIQSSSDSIL
jgi:hypothetical protein